MRPVLSAVRIFGKSLYMIAAGWTVSILWLWLAEIQISVRRHGAAPDNYAARTLIEGLLPAVAIALSANATVRWTGAAPELPLERREWHHAFWWSVFPNLMLLGTVYLMISVM